MFGFRGVFNRKPRQFEYRPIYYDPEKEARNQRRRELGLDVRDDKNDSERKPGDYLRSRASASRERFEAARSKQKAASFRTVLIILALFAIAIWLLMSIAD